jgi:peptidoglycan/LPS O-acetylase OafA/YrhL
MAQFDNLFIRFLGILLVTNSHLDHLYPIPQLATGGSLGNSLFFMISGYGLALSHLSKPLPFFHWYWRRITRIYPSFMLVLGIFWVWYGGLWRTWKWDDYVTALLWPVDYVWFISALMVFYVIFFIVMKLNRSKYYIFSILILFIPYLYFYFSYLDLSIWTIEGEGYFKWIFYFQVMLLGGYLGNQCGRLKSGKGPHLMLLCLSLSLYFSFGYFITHGHFTKYQFFMHLLTFPIIYWVLVLGRSPFIRNLMGQKVPLFVITMISSATLEIYLLQEVVYTNHFIKSLFFPLNVMVFLTILVVLSKIVEIASSSIRRILLREDR